MTRIFGAGDSNDVLETGESLGFITFLVVGKTYSTKWWSRMIKMVIYHGI